MSCNCTPTYSQSVSNSWQTVADHVKATEFTVKDLRPNTVYLFIIRAVNAQGLGDPSPMSEPVRTQGTTNGFCCTVTAAFFSCLYRFPPLDISPTAQGVDHRRVQKELGDVVVNMHNPVVLSSTTVQVTWTVRMTSNRSHFRTVLCICRCTHSRFSSRSSWCSISFGSFGLMVNQE